MQFTPKHTHTHTRVMTVNNIGLITWLSFLLSESYSPVAPWFPANVTIRPLRCVCPMFKRQGQKLGHHKDVVPPLEGPTFPTFASTYLWSWKT